jgi:hypothetical protein
MYLRTPVGSCGSCCIGTTCHKVDIRLLYARSLCWVSTFVVAQQAAPTEVPMEWPDRGAMCADQVRRMVAGLVPSRIHHHAFVPSRNGGMVDSSSDVCSYACDDLLCQCGWWVAGV